MFHIWNLLNPRAPEETFQNDVVTPRIVQDHAQQRASSRTIEEHDHYEGRSRQELALRNKILKSSAHLAADRVALRRTLSFVEERWRAGADCDETFSKAEEYRAQEYDKVAGDGGMMLDFEHGVKNLRPENARAQLVENGPIQKKKPSLKPRR